MSISSRENCLVIERRIYKFERNYFSIFSSEAIERNQQLEFERNIEKLQILKVKLSTKRCSNKHLICLFLKWSASAFNRLSIVPPGISVCQQINLEYLSKLILLENDNDQKNYFHLSGYNYWY